MKVSSIESLAKIGDVSIAPLLENFYQKDKEGRFWILNALRRLNADVAKSIFMSLCKDEDVDIQLLSISALSEFESSEESLEILLELLDHSLWRIRNESARTLSRLQDLSPEFLIRQLQEGFENRKYWMIKVMEQRSEAVFIKPLLNIFNGEDWVLKTAAADALQQIPYKESEDFIEILNGDSQSLIYWTTRSLIGDQNRDYIEPMINCLDTQSAGTRENAIEFFLRMGKKSHANLREVFEKIILVKHI